MASNYVSATLSPEDLEKIMQWLEGIREKLPFMIDVPAKVKQSMPKMGDKTRTFVHKSLDFALQHPEYLPRSFNTEEFKRDIDLFEVVYPLAMAITQLQADLEDTLTAVGSDAYSAALQVYRHAKAHGEGSGLDALVEDMGQRFERQPYKAKA